VAGDHFIQRVSVSISKSVDGEKPGSSIGTVIKTYLHDPRLKTTVNIILALLLVYIAFTLVGVMQ
jgi:hypothetical protein